MIEDGSTDTPAQECLDRLQGFVGCDGSPALFYTSDDFNHALGDAAEGRLAAALSFRDTGKCPAVTMASTLEFEVLGGDALLSGKSPGRTGRFLQPREISPR